MWKNASFLLVTVLFLGSCKDQTPDVPNPEPVPSIHIIDNYYYAQFTYGKAGDTMTYEVLDDSTAWTDSNYVNIVFDARNEAIEDTTGASEDPLEPPYLKTGWHYAPTTSLITKKLYDFRNPLPGEEPPIDELLDATNDIFSIQFPWYVDNDTVAVWDIQDYLENSVLKEGQIAWGRVGNNTFSDTIWNNDARNGVVVSYIDTAGMEWRSDNWPTFQPFGYFVINKIEPNFRDGESYDIIEGEFAARVYNRFQQWKDIRYGKFRMRLYSDIDLGPEPQ